MKRSGFLVAASIAMLMYAPVSLVAGGTVTCGGVEVTDRGTGENDVFTGTSQADVYHGGGGNDTIEGMGGDDILCGGGGEDHISGGTDKDLIFGGEAFDALDGETENDTINGGPGDDVIHGGPDNDTVSGGPGIEKLAGGLGTRDWVAYHYDSAPVIVRLDRERATKSGSDRDEVKGFENVIGTNSADEIYGNRAENRILAIAGNDLLVGLEGLDQLEGGADDDRVSYGDMDVGVVVNLELGRARRGDVVLDRLSSIEIVWGTPGNDKLIGDAFENVLRGFRGHDRLEGKEKHDELFGAPGDDVLVGGAGADLLHGGRGTDTCSPQQADTRRECERR